MQLCSYNTLDLTTRQKCVIYEDKPKTRQERFLHNTPKCVSKAWFTRTTYMYMCKHIKQRKQSMTSPLGLAKIKHPEFFFVSPFFLLLAYAWTMLMLRRHSH